MDNLIINADYKVLFKQLKKQKIKIDAIITDPPYNVSRGKECGFTNMGRAGMNYGNWDYNFNQTSWIKNAIELLKDGGAIIIFNDWKNLGIIAKELEKHNCIVKDIIRWVKTNPMPRNVDRRYVMDAEFALWATKSGASWTFNKPEDKSFLKPEFKTGVVPGGKNRLHPTQKHLEVMEQLVEIHTNINDIVLDPFLGSGTTALACQNRNRICVGSEIDKKYYDIILERLKK